MICGCWDRITSGAVSLNSTTLHRLMALLDLQMNHRASGCNCDLCLTYVLKALKYINNPSLFMACFYLLFFLFFPQIVVKCGSAKIAQNNGVKRQLIRLGLACCTSSVAPTQKEQQVSTGLLGRPWKPVCCRMTHQRRIRSSSRRLSASSSRPIRHREAIAQYVQPPAPPTHTRAWVGVSDEGTSWRSDEAFPKMVSNTFFYVLFI